MLMCDIAQLNSWFTTQSIKDNGKSVYLQNVCNCSFFSFYFLAYDCEYFNKGKS